MIDSIRKTIIAGLGAAAITADKAFDGLEDLVKQGKISSADARAAAERIAKNGKVEFDKASAKVGDKLREFSGYADGEYLKRLEALEKRIATLEVKHVKAAKRRPSA
jgi:polyhydroxyalkanoate synthesis regulator phasin